MIPKPQWIYEIYIIKKDYNAYIYTLRHTRKETCTCTNTHKQTQVC